MYFLQSSHYLDGLALGVDQVLGPDLKSQLDVWEDLAPRMIDILLLEGSRNTAIRMAMPDFFNKMPAIMPSTLELKGASGHRLFDEPSTSVSIGAAATCSHQLRQGQGTTSAGAGTSTRRKPMVQPSMGILATAPHTTRSIFGSESVNDTIRRARRIRKKLVLMKGK
jgi:hypothetical protein